MKKLNYSLFLILVLFWACDKKEFPKDLIENTEASFFSNLVINGTPLSLEAGKNNYYMYASYEQDSNGVYHFIGELRSANQGNNSPNSLKIQFNDSKISANNAASNISQSILPGNYKFFDGTYTTSYGIEFESTYNRDPKNYNWDFGDGLHSSEANPVHTYKSAGFYNICLSSEGNNFCSSTICNSIEIGTNSFNAFITATNSAGNSMSFSSNTVGGKAPFSYFWTFGDGSSDQSSNPNHQFAITGSYPVKLKITDSDSKIRYISYNAVTGEDLSSCASNIKIKSILPSQNNLGLNEVLVSFTDVNGINFSSKLNPQSSSSLFNVISVEDFENNEKGEKTKKVKLKFNCKLYSGNIYLNIENAELVFCVAYK